ncbi:hypothetical protein [Paenibacillus sp. N3.4]|uniref:hypothetical protein n=1 Tax=Paenibacillus sp. N3.4 TaxID=2603222 RepID=UPI00164EFC02|nr:hypothetical protein [Paenibacillus sp. N3.4]
MNHILAGNSLAAEIIPTLQGHRKFIIIRPYVMKDVYGHELQSKPNKYLNDLSKNNELFFSILQYEINEKDMDKEWDLNNEDIKLRECITDIRGTGKLEVELNSRNFDLTALDAEWKCDNPI